MKLKIIQAQHLRVNSIKVPENDGAARADDEVLHTTDDALALNRDPLHCEGLFRQHRTQVVHKDAKLQLRAVHRQTGRDLLVRTWWGQKKVLLID